MDRTSGFRAWVFISAANEGGEMSDGSTRTMTFQATAPEVYAALLQAAERTGWRYLSGDGETGTYVFTTGMMALTFGEKVTVRLTQVPDAAVQVTLSSDLQFGVRGAVGRSDAGADRLADALAMLLPRAG